MPSPFLDDADQLLREGRVKTSSKLRMAWLSTFRGYKVETRTQTPMGYSLGRLQYKTSWVLKPKEVKSETS